MNITRNLIAAVLMTIVTTIILGVICPLAITGIAQVVFPDQANGQLIEQNGKVVGSRIIGQEFASPGYLRSRPRRTWRRRGRRTLMRKPWPVIAVAAAPAVVS